MKWITAAVSLLVVSCAAPAAPPVEKWEVEEEPYLLPWERGIPVVVHELEDGCTPRLDCPGPLIPRDFPSQRFEFQSERVYNSEYSHQTSYFGIEIGDLPLHVFAIPQPAFRMPPSQLYNERGLNISTGTQASRIAISEGEYADALEEIIEPTYVGYLENKEFITYHGGSEGAFPEEEFNWLAVIVEPPTYTFVFWIFYDDFRTAVRVEMDTHIFWNHTVASHRQYWAFTTCPMIDRTTTDICEGLPRVRYSEPFAVDIPTLVYKSELPE